MLGIDTPIDFLYTFQYTDKHIDKAVQRLICSVDSIKNQMVRVIVLNASNKCIKDNLPSNITYIHKPCVVQGSKSLLINHGVKNYVKTDYFCISDIDLIYHPQHIEKLVTFNKKHFEDTINKPIRIIFYNYNLSREKYSSNWNELFMYPHIDRLGGEAHGNGVIHRKSFMAIKGFEELFVGYGCEDSHFNIRIEKINKIVYEKPLHTYHLWHIKGTTPFPSKLNDALWNDKKKIIEKCKVDWLDIRANFDNLKWGEY